MAKYEYEQGKTYLSESTPIVVSRIPSGTYKITVTSGNATKEVEFSASPGVKDVTVQFDSTVISDWNISGAYIRFVGGE